MDHNLIFALSGLAFKRRVLVGMQSKRAAMTQLAKIRDGRLLRKT
jgi:hypothetical protein